jgi:hypothetical protein
MPLPRPCFCDRGTHQFQARCPASRSRPSPVPGAAQGSRRGPAFWWARPSGRVNDLITSAAWSGRAIVTRMGGDARRGTRLRCAANAGRALERDPSPSGEGRPKNQVNTINATRRRLYRAARPRPSCVRSQPSTSPIFRQWAEVPDPVVAESRDRTRLLEQSQVSTGIIAA